MTDKDLDDQIEEKKAEIKKKKAKIATDRVLDPMIVDPDAEQQERFAGTTSDASTHVEGTAASEVPPDPASYPDKASDAEDYDFPPGGDTDIATREGRTGVGPAADEVMPRPTVEDWVVLEGADAAVPDALDGRRAVILGIEPDQEFYTAEEIATVVLTVRTRDDYSATLAIPWTGVKEIQRGGKSPMRV